MRQPKPPQEPGRNHAGNDDYYYPSRGHGGMTHPNPRYADGKHADELERSLKPPMYLEERTVTFGGETCVVDSYDPRVDRHRQSDFRSTSRIS